MTRRFTLATIGILALALTAWAAQEKPTTQPGMPMDAMMKQCMEHMQQCRTHIDAAAKAEHAGKHDETMKHLTGAQEQMNKCMQMMEMMQKMHGGMMGGEAMWTCPMHPQVIQDKPGKCPICNMDLVQAKPAEPRGRGEQ